ncbi:MAG: MFS transporter [Chloroflexi bacterium]|nr:MFS transporter [Chloroflexota bacterium]
MSEKIANSWGGALLRKTVRSPAMRFQDFRLLMMAAFFDSIGFMGESVVLGWVILELTDSPFMVGVAIGIRHAPAFFLGVVAGTVADMIDRRKLMRSLMAVLALVAVGMGLLLTSGKVQLWQLLVLPAVGGSISTVTMTTRQSFVFDVVGRENALSGMAYLSLAMRAGGMIGALIVGFVLAKIGPGAGYFVLAGGYFVSTGMLSLIRSRGQSAPAGGSNMLKGLLEFWTELRHNSTVSALVIVVVFVEFFGFTTFALMPSLARDVLHIGAGGLGVLTAFFSFGGVLGILVVSLFGEIRRQGLAFIVVLHVFGVALLLLGFAPNIYIAVAAIVVMSGMMALSDLFSQTLMQRLVPNNLRGRAMGAWTAAVGTAPVGNLEIGALASFFGVTAALAIHGAGLIVVAVITLAVFGKLRRV